MKIDGNLISKIMGIGAEGLFFVAMFVLVLAPSKTKHDAIMSGEEEPRSGIFDNMKQCFANITKRFHFGKMSR